MLGPRDGRLTISEPIHAAFLGEQLSRWAKRVRAGESLPAPLQIRWSEELANLVRDGLQSWLLTGEYDNLLRLVEEVPHALAHPVVVELVRRLRRLGQGAEREALEGSVWLAGEADPFPEGTCKVAEEALRRLAGAVTSGLFQTSGWSVQPPRTRGRPRRSLADTIEAQSILGDYDMVLGHLRLRQTEFKQRKGETEADWVVRLKGLIRQAWADSGIGKELVADTDGGPRERPTKTGDSLDIFDTPIKITERPLPLPDKVAVRCTQEIGDQLAGRPFLDHIAYSLVGHRWGLAPRSVRHKIEVARPPRVKRSRRSPRNPSA